MNMTVLAVPYMERKGNTKLINQMNSRGWTESLIKDTVDNPTDINAFRKQAPKGF